MSKTIERKLRNAVTVRELIDQLSWLPEEAVVLFTCDYGDHCHTQQALPVSEAREINEDEVIKESAYSRSGLAMSEVEEGDESDTKPELEEQTFVILS